MDSNMNEIVCSQVFGLASEVAASMRRMLHIEQPPAPTRLHPPLSWTPVQQFLAQHRQGDRGGFICRQLLFLASKLGIFGASSWFFCTTVALVLKLCRPPFDEQVLISEFSSIFNTLITL
jgi:hypothetical protein